MYLFLFIIYFLLICYLFIYLFIYLLIYWFIYYIYRVCCKTFVTSSTELHNSLAPVYISLFFFISIYLSDCILIFVCLVLG